MKEGTVISAYDTYMTTSKKCVAAWLDTDIKYLVIKKAGIKGVSISEYLRNLIFEDLDKSTIFTTLLLDRQGASL